MEYPVKYQAEFRRDRPRGHFFVTFILREGEPEKDQAYRALADHLGGITTVGHWELTNLIECDPPLRWRTPNEHAQLIAERIINKIENGIYQPGQRMPRRTVWAAQLGVTQTSHLTAAVRIAAAAGYLRVTNPGTYIQPPEHWQLHK